MPGIIIGVVGLAVAVAIGETAAIIAAAVTLAAAVATFALQGKAETAPLDQPFTAAIESRKQNIRSTILPRRIGYGDFVIGGNPILAVETGTSPNAFLHVVIPLVDHRIEEIGDIWANNVKVGTLDADGEVTDGQFSGKMRVRKFLGHDDQTADPDLVSEVGVWTEDHRGRGVAYIYVRMQEDATAYPAGLPTFVARIKGKHVYDPRKKRIQITSSTAADPGVFSATRVHNLSVRQRVWLSEHTGATDSENIAVEGEFQVGAVPTSTTFTLLDRQGNPLHLKTAGTGGFVSVMSFSNNWALCVRDYVTGEYSVGVKDNELSEAHIFAAANNADENVLLASTEFDDFTAANVDISADTITLVSQPKIPTGEIVKFEANGGLPSPLVDGNELFAIETPDPTVYKFAFTRDDAFAGVAITFGSTGSGTNRVIRHAQTRYDCNGHIEVDGKPLDVLENLMTAGFGAFDYAPGKYRIHAGAFNPPSFELDERDLVGTLVTDMTTPLQEKYNSVRAVFVNPSKNWETDDIPPRVNAFYERQDGARLTRDIQLPFTTDLIRASRIAEAHLRDSRQPFGLRWPANLRPVGVTPWEIGDITISDMGWERKKFRNLGVNRSLPGALSLQLKETAPSVYQWDGGEEEMEDPAPNTELPDAFFASQILGLGLSTNGSNQLVLDWDLHLSELVRDEGRIEMQFKLAAAPTWTPAVGVLGDQTQKLIGVPAGTYDVRIRAVNGMGIESVWATKLSYTRGGAAVGVQTRTDWGSVANTPTVFNDYGSVANAPTVFNDWGTVV